MPSVSHQFPVLVVVVRVVRVVDVGVDVEAIELVVILVVVVITVAVEVTVVDDLLEQEVNINVIAIKNEVTPTQVLFSYVPPFICRYPRAELVVL